MLKHLFLLLLVHQIVHANEFLTDVRFETGTQQSLQIDSRYALYQQGGHLLFANLRGGIGSTTDTFTPGTQAPFLEGNVGLNYRTAYRRGILGFYSYYGQLKTPYDNVFSRAALGVEYFTQRYGGYLNVYAPLGERSQTINRRFEFGEISYFFRGHDLFERLFGRREHMSPLGIELGLDRRFGRLEARARGHYYTQDREGGSFDLSYDLNRNGQLKGRVGYDSFYKTQAQIGFSYSFGNRAIANRCKRRAFRPVRLEEFFWVQRNRKETSDEIVKTDFYFVDSARSYSGGFQGDGTFETPFLTAQLANTAIATVPDATVYFYQGAGPYQNFGTFNLFGTQTLTGEGGDYLFRGTVVLPGSNATRPFLARTAAQQAANTPLVTVTDGGANVIENIGLSNISGAVATGGSMVTAIGSSIDSLRMTNVTSSDKVSLFLTAGNQAIRLFDNDIYGVDIKTLNSAVLDLQVEANLFRTNTIVATRFNQAIGASLFMESLNSSAYTVSSCRDNTCLNTRLNGSAHLGFGYLSSGTSTNVTPNGFIGNTSIGNFAAPTAGAFLFQGVDASRVQIEGCFGNFSATNGFTLQLCDVNIKQAGVPATVAGLSQANGNTAVAPFFSVVITNTP
ncbi:MAG: hypothetical protein S4CHLAM2_14260 [Chlamydiales bacterium]|nr:hypothetical protein [Chlamydiales bacterium]